MPIIQNHSDKHKPRLIVLSLLYVLTPILILAFLFNFFSDSKPDANTVDRKETKYICFEKDVEQYLVDRVDTWTIDHSEYKTVLETQATNCNVIVERNISDPNDLTKLLDTTYILVRKEGSRVTNITETDLLKALISQRIGEYTLIWNSQTDSFLRSNFNIGVGQIISTDAQISEMLLSDDLYIAVVKEDFDTTGRRIIRIDNQSPFTKNYSSSRYPLVDRYWIGGTSEGDINLIYDILLEKTGSEE